MQEWAGGAHNGQKSVFSGQRNVMCTAIKGVFNGLQFTWIGVIYWVIYPVVSKLDEVVLLCQKMSHYPISIRPLNFVLGPLCNL